MRTARTENATCAKTYIFCNLDMIIDELDGFTYAVVKAPLDIFELLAGLFRMRPGDKPVNVAIVPAARVFCLSNELFIVVGHSCRCLRIVGCYRCEIT